MIKVNNLNKKYNKGKRNEIHVINNISLDLPKTGLVCLLGPSGSGKSTLLNAIGGLDKVDSGVINFEGNEIKKYSSRKWDKLRNDNFGYIFQNYNLLPDISVYDNIKFSLQLSNIIDEEIDERINYALTAVKMEKFKKRKARNLSGGQQQRVAIARALVTSPNVIIADEPTGNLDAANSTQVMNIIKKISQECLVILVTHNTNLAYFYADRIIELKDGQIIKDYKNISFGNLDFKQDQNIYLQDYQKSVLADENIELSYFYNEEKPPVDIKVIFKDNTFYITANSELSKIKFLSPGDEIKIIDAKKTGISQAEVEDFDYRLEKINKRNSRRISVISSKEAFKLAFRKIKGFRKFQKLLLSGFVISAIMIVAFTSSLIGSFKISSNTIESIDRHLISVNRIYKRDPVDLNTFVNEIYELKKQAGIDHFTSQQNLNLLTLPYDIFLQISMYSEENLLNGSIADISVVNNSDIILGKYPTNINDILVDKAIITRLLNDYTYSSIGYTRLEDFIDHEFKFNNKVGKISGITNTKNPTIYMHSLLKNGEIYTEYILQTLFESYETTYKEPLKSDEVLINQNAVFKQNVKINGIDFKVKGTFSSSQEANYVLSEEGLERLNLVELINYDNLAIYSTNTKETLAFLSNREDINVYNLYDQRISNYKRDNVLQLSSQMIFSNMILVGTLLLLFFMIRSSMINRIYEIGVYRALGVPKKDIYKIFGIEITIITLFTSAVGWGLISYVFLKSLKDLVSQRMYYSWPLAFMILLGIWGLNLLVGLLPVTRLLRKTPSEILTKYDL